ncbi:MAG: hypothetical protein U0793_04230 [Gemmataceae bacterium]
MNVWSRLLAFFALSGLALVTVASAGDKKDKADAKTDKDAKTDAKEKKGDKKKEDAKEEEKVVYGGTAEGKIKRFASESSKDFTLEVLMRDPKKEYNLAVWQAQQRDAIARANPRNGDQARALLRYQQELAKKMANPLETMTAQDVDMRAVDKIVVRSLYPPMEYDDKGNIKRWTEKELRALRGKTKLPGYPSEYENLKPNHIVTVYLAKIEAPKGPKKKLDDDAALGSTKPEVVMIVIKAEPIGR